MTKEIKKNTLKIAYKIISVQKQSSRGVLQGRYPQKLSKPTGEHQYISIYLYLYLSIYLSIFRSSYRKLASVWFEPTTTDNMYIYSYKSGLL